MKLGIALPIAGRLFDKEFWISFVLMDKNEWTLVIPRIEVYHLAADIARIRNDIVAQALESDIDKLIMMDTDQVYPVDTIQKLKAHDKLVVGTPVHRRYPPFDVIMLRGELGKYLHVPDEEIYSGDLVEVDATGTGCICFDMQIFKEFNPPWFKIETGEDGQAIGEDIGFCARLRKAGVPIYVDTSIEIDHVAPMLITKETYQLFRKIKGFEWNPGDELDN